MEATQTPDKLWPFIGRTDVYAIQCDTGIYIPVKEELTADVLRQHLSGTKTIGSYVIRQDGLANFGAIDIDCEPEELPKYVLVSNELYALFPDFHRVLEFSGRRGYHIWILLDKPEQPKFIRELIKSRIRKWAIDNEERLKELGINTDFEVFPKQDVVTGKGYGNLIKVPLGLHKLTGKFSEIMKEDLPVKEDDTKKQ